VCGTSEKQKNKIFVGHALTPARVFPLFDFRGDVDDRCMDRSRSLQEDFAEESVEMGKNLLKSAFSS